MATVTEQYEGWSLPRDVAPEQTRVVVDAFVAEFSRSVSLNPLNAAILRDLSEEAARQLQLAYSRHLQLLLSPQMDEGLWKRSAEQVADLHLRHRIPVGWICEGHRLFLGCLARHAYDLGLTAEDCGELCSCVTQRLFQDISLLTAACSLGLEARQRVRELLAELDRLLLTVPTVAALYTQLTDFVLQIPGIDGAWLGSPDDQDLVQFHFAAGEGVEQYLAGAPIHLRDYPDTPLARAWSTGQPQFLADWSDIDQPIRDPFWRERGLRFGWRSSCSIPVAGTGTQRDILTLYSKHVDFFVEEEIHRLIVHLHGLLGMALERLRMMEAMEQKQQMLTLYKAAVDASGNGISITDASTPGFPFCYVNPAFERITGYSAEEAIGQGRRFLFRSDSEQSGLEKLRQPLRNGESCTVELKNYRKDGTLFWNSLSIAPVKNDAGEVTHFVGIQNDVTSQREALAASARANALYRALMGTAELIVRAQSERELLDDLSRLLVESGLFPHVWIGRPNPAGDIEVLSTFSTLQTTEYWYRPNVHTDDEDRVVAVRAWRRSALQYSNDRLADPDYPVIQDFYRKHGLRSTAVVPLYRDGELWALLALLSDEVDVFTAELLELLERIGRLVGHGLDSIDLHRILEDERQHQSWLARHDALTDILNRRGLMERLDEAIARARRHKRLLAVAIMDLDGFRIVNDLHGHPAGDLLLRTIAERLQTALRQTDSVGRLGGDEFVLILEDLDQEDDLPMTLTRVLAAVEGPIHLPNGRVASVRGSIGVTLFPQDDAPPDRLLRHADRALFALKESTEPAQQWSIFHAEADEKKIVRKKTILTLFRAGMVRVHYQPIVDLQTGTVSGVEALARMVDTDNTLLLPAEFLPQLSASDLGGLTHQVLAQSAQDLQRADKAGFHLTVGINFEPTTLADPKAMEELRSEIESSGIAPSRIVLEMLERADTLSVAGSQKALQALKSCGARIALDDVGSAYSSLLRVKELPVDIIKLDRSFLIGMEHHPKELRFLLNMVHLARALGLVLVAEGIESHAVGDALAALGVRQAQGYWIGRPMAIKELLQWLQHYKAAAWTHPTSALGAVALQLRNLDAAGRIMEQRPSFLQHLVSGDTDLDGNASADVHIGPLGGRLTAAHRRWQSAIATLASDPEESSRSRAFQAARTAYEEEMFDAALDAAMSTR